MHGLPQRRDRLGGAAAFQQRLAFEFVEIGIGRLGLNKAIDLADRLAQIGVAVGRDRARVTRGQAVIAERIAPRHRIGPFQEAGQFGAHQVVPRLQVRRVLDVEIGAGLDQSIERGDAIGRHRMRLQIRIDKARVEQGVAAQPFEQVEHAAAGLPGGVEKLCAGMVGLVFLSADIGQKRTLDRRLRPQDRGRCIATAGARGGHRRADAEQQRDHGGGLRRRQLLAQLEQMAAGQMPGLMREHANDLVRRLGIEQCAGIDEDVPAIHDEGIEGAVVEHDHLDVLLGEAGGLEARLRVVAQQLLDLGIADDRHAGGGVLRARRRHGTGAGQGDSQRRGYGKAAHYWRVAPAAGRWFDRCMGLDFTDICHVSTR